MILLIQRQKYDIYQSNGTYRSDQDQIGHIANMQSLGMCKGADLPNGPMYKVLPMKWAYGISLNNQTTDMNILTARQFGFHKYPAHAESQLCDTHTYLTFQNICACDLQCKSVFG